MLWIAGIVAALSLPQPGASALAQGATGTVAAPRYQSAEGSPEWREYEEAVSGLREALRKAAHARTELAYSGLDDGEAARKAWIETIYATNPARIRYEEAAIRLFESLDRPELEHYQMMLQIVEKAFLKRQMIRANRAARLVADRVDRLQPGFITRKDRDFLDINIGVSALFLGDVATGIPFARGNQILMREMDDVELDLVDQLDAVRAATEAEARRSPPAEPLPRVRLVTELGDIEVELFEDEAPRTVNNFVAIVERGLLDDTVFHAVFAGTRVQGGVFGRDGKPRFSGVMIEDECRLPGARHHLHGTLSMALMNDRPNTASTQFMILCRPDCNLDGRQTAFGRVVRGMEIVERIEPTLKLDEKSEEPKVVEEEGARPTWLIRAEVLQKRNHEYRIPDPLPQTLPGAGS